MRIRISSRDNVIPKGRKGWINPEGFVMPLDDDYDLHGKWINRHYEELKKIYPDLPSEHVPPGVVTGEFDNYDAIRDFLINKDWVHVYGIRDIMIPIFATQPEKKSQSI